MAEQLIRNEQVAGSIPVTSSNKSHFCLWAKVTFFNNCDIIPMKNFKTVL